MFSPELEFILHTARTKIEPAQSLRLKKLLSNNLNWDKIFATSEKHRVQLLMYNNIMQTNFLREHIQPELLLKLKNTYHQALLTNILRWQEFCRLADSFNQRQIEVIPLKGVILGDLLYHNPALRLFADTDILVRQKDIAAASEILKNLNYREIPEKTRYYNIKFMKKDCFQMLEIHWLLKGFIFNNVKIGELWQRSIITGINNRKIRILSNEDLLLTLILQVRSTGHNQFFQLFRFCDINELITQKKGLLDWDLILKLCERYRLTNVLCLPLILSKELLFTPVPADVLKRLSKNSLRRKLFMKLDRDKSAALVFHKHPSKRLKALITAARVLMRDSFITSFKIFVRKIFNCLPPPAGSEPENAPAQIDGSCQPLMRL